MADNKADKVDFNSEDFHKNLEQKIEPGLREPETKPVPEDNNKPKKVETTVEEDWKLKFEKEKLERENLEKRYEASTKEGKRLSALEEEYNKLKPYEPLLSRIGNDENLQKKIESHIKGVPDEEKLSFEDILTDEKAFSTVIAQTVGAEIDKRLGMQRQEDEKRQLENERKSRDRDFQLKYNLSDDQMEDFREKMKGKILTHEDMYKLVYGKELEQKKEQNELKDILSQLAKTGQIPKSLAHLQTLSEDQKTETDEVFDSLKGTTSSVDDMLK